MELDWRRIARTAVQSASGAGIALITAVASDWRREAVAAACVQFVCTVAIAVLMNVNKQAKEGSEDGEEDI